MSRFFQPRGTTRITPPATPPVGVPLLRDSYLKLPDNSDDEMLRNLIDASVAYIEGKLNLAFITQSWRMTLDHWPGNREAWWNGVRVAHINTLTSVDASEQVIPIFPLISVDSITADGNAVNVGETFVVDTTSEPGRIVLALGQTWPVITNLTANAIVIEFTSGFGPNPEDIPGDAKLAIIKMAEYMYEHTGCAADEAYKKSGARGFLQNYNRRKI